MRGWFRQHRFALGSALIHLRKSPSGFLLNVFVVAIALSLPFAGLTMLDNVRPMSEQMSVDPEMSVFLKIDTPREQAKGLAGEIRRIVQGNKKAKIVFIPREDALDSLKSKNGLADVLNTLGENPLPDSYVLKLDAFNSATEAQDVDAVAEQLRQLPGVESVQVDSAWVKRLAALLGVLRLVLLLLAITLGAAVIAVVFNTIRLQVMTQRDEISVSKLIGATDTFIHRPFYYTGALLGLCAGALALGAVALALRPLNTAIAEFARLYASEFQLAPLAPLPMAALLAMSAGLGLIGAFLCVQRHLARVN
ncbi:MULTISPECIES: permease-like cell division protein FtsX [unclassified Janthinobacterium]|uniref:permease-like cell division protein FtsX n=1 Tax=unclassified Janthinobacterium TaxID=2610881 RepID=UPI0016103F09|nr:MULTISPECIES: permease-like cell division protein FtsX [unclassified Janthinobacterium]MBB5370558.1 cell division transport system permease protein [Janthinobacterium sp. K2C7]MBB5383228.1 cell division transport system permease protein [Janthinobacterium sp. K2Li3]MBB5388682.1 cell division transport system permease protein [Janthinobacterium sp. K2E3]